jgi:hypothetical protein
MSEVPRYRVGLPARAQLSEVPLYTTHFVCRSANPLLKGHLHGAPLFSLTSHQCLQRLACRGTSPTRKRPPPWDPRHRPTVGSYGVAFSYERGTPVQGWAPSTRAMGMRSQWLQRLQGYLAHKKHPLPRTLQWDYLGPCGGPRGGGCF